MNFITKKREYRCKEIISILTCIFTALNSYAWLVMICWWCKIFNTKSAWKSKSL